MCQPIVNRPPVPDARTLYWQERERRRRPIDEAAIATAREELAQSIATKRPVTDAIALRAKVAKPAEDLRRGGDRCPDCGGKKSARRLRCVSCQDKKVCPGCHRAGVVRCGTHCNVCRQRLAEGKSLERGGRGARFKEVRRAG